MRSGRPIIALVEDDPLLRVPLAQGLDSAGYTVVAAASGLEAITLLEDPEIDVAIVDVKLGGRIDGLSVIREAQRNNPSLRAVLISGADPPGDVSDVGAFLRKPFRVAELTALLAQLLSGPVPGADGSSATPST